MPIAGKGWELHVVRTEVQTKGAKKRTYGRYQVFINGNAVAGLSGFMCESRGPGNNGPNGQGLRVKAGRYPITTQYGRYRSQGYSNDTSHAGRLPMPGFRLEETGDRVAILVHPGHPPKLFLSSIGCLNPTEQLDGAEDMSFWDSRKRVIAMLDSLRSFHAAAFDEEVNTEIPNAFVVIDGEPMGAAKKPVLAASVPQLAGATNVAMAIPVELPISEKAARKCTQWLWDNFSSELSAAVQGKAYRVEHLAAIVCQETAYKWVPWIGSKSVKEIVERAVYDASGDAPGTSRGAFPKNTAAFRARYDKAFTDLLIEEANATRALQGWGPKQWVYKGYGLFQYDLQEVTTDRKFFEQKQWYDFATCVAKCTGELDGKLKATKGDLWLAIKAYNGSGAKAQRYLENVRYYTPICADVIAKATPKPKAKPKPAAELLRSTAMSAAAATQRKPSGPQWVSQFPDGGQISELDPAFAASCERFIAALKAAGASVAVNSAKRPKERAYLMHSAWRIAKEGADPQTIPAFPGVFIDWVHRNAAGKADLNASRAAARAMVSAYGLAFRPSMTSNHILGKAVDMSISWSGTLKVANASGASISISSSPRTGMNTDLWRVGRSYGVVKHPTDRPHWSVNGR